MEVQDKIETSEIKAINDVLNQTFDSILRQYNSLLFAITDNAGKRAIEMAEEQLKIKEIDISDFPNKDKLQFYITHYVKDIPAIARLQQYINKNKYPNKIQEKIMEDTTEAHLGLNSRLFLVHECEKGIQEILTGWAILQFIIEHPSRVSIATIEQLMQYGYQGTCGTPIMKEMFSLIYQIQQLQNENEDLKNELNLGNQMKKT